MPIVGAGTDDGRVTVASMEGDFIGPRAEVIVGTWIARAVCGVPEEAGHVKVITAIGNAGLTPVHQARGPLDLAGRHVQRQDGVHMIIG